MSRPAPVPSRLVRAAGSLVWRFTDPERTAIPGESLKASEIQVLIVHRPRYRDWSWPKGKAEANEPIVAAAVREVEEETGVVAVLHAPLTTQRYRLGSGQTKEVHYWVGTVAPGEAVSPVTRSRTPVRPAPSSEIDQTRWASPAKADQLLTRRGDRRLLSELVARAQDGRLVTTTMVMARHAKAISRHSWHESEATRPLTRVGARQAIDLVDLLSAFGIEECVSSPWTRCMQTLSPWAGLSGGELSVRGELTETAVEGDPSAAGDMTAALLRKIEVPTALCVHRPTIPVLLKPLKAIAPSSLARSFPNHSPWLATAEILVAHISRADTEPHLLSLERHATRTKLLFGV
ncbi:NUDIX hydrolase [Schaalia cardiffensis]|uniref:NUDIX hydrolase n=1 Tax=Schaalia cardiffensis TaxID=181487 RepID=UPI0018E7779B|nr:NUDIX hydrolase [Schaalia cardiffensis]MBJ2329631.1 NUDIX hydrolase [Schaalia cardiffensis]